MTFDGNLSILAQAADYGIDTIQRSILFWDTLRKRGNNYIEHNHAGKPSVLTFDYEMIADGRALAQPVNYALLKITALKDKPTLPGKRPIIVIDPRAGHGPGVGGFKIDSEIGFALKNGHPVYFISFFADPVPGQTITAVQQAEIGFIQQVADRHPHASDPAVIGNCQAGWALALIGADRPDVTGPMVLVGSPLSYWAGAGNKNPMRYRGGFSGGVWTVSFLSDLGNGKFDGANLVAGFEDLNPANTFWKKYYQLYANVDKAGDRFLNFERWWNGYFYMTGEEIHFIVKHLFVDNSLESGELVMENGRHIDLKKIEDPVVVFASEGDNITPPQQALNWIANAYGSVDEIKRNGQVIIYRVHADIGHLGIFVSGRVARKEHRKIIDTIDLTELLSPGLYEMVLSEKPSRFGMPDYDVRFEERTISDILALDDGQADEKPFRAVAAMSNTFDSIYRLFFQPLVKAASSEPSARLIRQLHPLRVSRYLISDRNPLMVPVKAAAPLVISTRRSTADGNLFKVLENYGANITAGVLDLYRDLRDATTEMMFRLTYEHSLMRWLYDEATASEKRSLESSINDSRNKYLDAENLASNMIAGGFANAVIRIMVLMAGVDRVFHETELNAFLAVLKSNRRLHWINTQRLGTMIEKQSALIGADQTQAIATLATLLPDVESRRAAIDIAEKIANADHNVSTEEAEMVAEVKWMLALS